MQREYRDFRADAVQQLAVRVDPLGQEVIVIVHADDSSLRADALFGGVAAQRIGDLRQHGAVAQIGKRRKLGGHWQVAVRVNERRQQRFPVQVHAPTKTMRPSRTSSASVAASGAVIGSTVPP